KAREVKLKEKEAKKAKEAELKATKAKEAEAPKEALLMHKLLPLLQEGIGK
ncbi:hypothetical protein Tco_0623651, partial [Tanacetum coccineum]